MQARFAWRCCAFASLVTLIIYFTTSVTSSEQLSVLCPFEYKRHSIDDIRTRAKRPYLFGGIYDNERECVNCKRGALWSTFCGFTNTGKVPFWDNQLCNSSQVEAAIDRVLQQNDRELLQMTPCDLWHYLRGRTTWIIGDSMSKDLYKALRCFLVEFHDLRTYHASNNYTAMHLLNAIPGYGEPHCIHMPEHTRLCQVHAIQGDLFIEGNRTKVGVIPLLLQSMAMSHDIFIINFGLWHGETRQPEYSQNLHQLGQYYLSVKDKFPNMFFMETPKQHFDSADGDYKVPWIGVRKGPWVCQPIKGVSMDADGNLHGAPGDRVAEYVVTGSWRNQLAHQILVEKYNMPFMPIYNTTATAWEFHRRNFDGQECSHFCHPSIPQLWLWSMKQAFKKWWITPVHNWMHLKPKVGCASILERDEARLGLPLPVEDMLAQQHREAGFWSWLLGRKKPQLRDGVVVFNPSSPATSSHATTLQPWATLQKVLDQQQQQQPQPQPQQQQKDNQQQKDDHQQQEMGQQQGQEQRRQGRAYQQHRRRKKYSGDLQTDN